MLTISGAAAGTTGCSAAWRSQRQTVHDSPTQITATTAAHAGGPVDLVVNSA